MARSHHGGSTRTRRGGDRCRRIRHLEGAQAQGQQGLPRLRRCSAQKKKALDLGGRGRRHDGDERALIVSLDEASQSRGAKNEPAR
jgi:hypothetical protein